MSSGWGGVFWRDPEAERSRLCVADRDGGRRDERQSRCVSNLGRRVERYGVFSLGRNRTVLTVVAAPRTAAREESLRLRQRARETLGSVRGTVNQLTVLEASNVIDEPEMRRA
ncbi:MAG: hypothetical protein AAGF92_09270 [Myxococcota bacterium]